MSETYKATIVGETVTIKIGTVELQGMRKVSEWEGFTKYEGKLGVLILAREKATTDTFENFFGSIFNIIDKPEPPQLYAIQASPQIAALLRNQTVTS